MGKWSQHCQSLHCAIELVGIFSTSTHYTLWLLLKSAYEQAKHLKQRGSSNQDPSTLIYPTQYLFFDSPLTDPLSPPLYHIPIYQSRRSFAGRFTPCGGLGVERYLASGGRGVLLDKMADVNWLAEEGPLQLGLPGAPTIPSTFAIVSLPTANDFTSFGGGKKADWTL